MYFSTAGERLLQELKLMEALPEEPQRIKSALAVAEKLTLGLRNHYEANWHPHPAPGRLMKAPIAYAGSIGMTEYGWLHIELNNLLPHCRFSTPEYLHDTLARLLRGYAAVHRLPHFEKAFLAIEEWSDIPTRSVYDPDNKGWKAIPNAIKGVLVDDDDQYSLEIALLSKQSAVTACHIYILDADEADVFFRGVAVILEFIHRFTRARNKAWAIFTHGRCWFSTAPMCGMEKCGVRPWF